MKTIHLPEVVDRTVATGLALELSDALGGGPGVTIHAGKVRQIGNSNFTAEQIAQSTRCLRATALGEHRAEYLFEQPHGLLLFGRR